MSPTASPMPLAAEWISQLRLLQQSLRDDPQHSQAWRWRIRVKVLTYLILRYGGDPWIDPRASRDCRRPLLTLRAIFPRAGSPIRTRRELREILARIAEINRDKLDLAPR